MIPKTSRRHDLNLTNLDVGFLFNEIDSWKHLDDFKYPRIDTFTKQNFGAIKALIEYCNINMTVIPADTWGYYNETTKTWDGLVEMIQHKKIQLSGTSPYFTAPRFEVVDFIKMQNPFTVQFVMKKPPISLVYNIFTLPFNANVWMCLGITVMIFIVAIYVAYNWESKTNKRFSQKGRFSLSDVMLVTTEVMCQQGTLVEPESTPSRILVLFFFIAFMFIYSSYSAYIIVVLQSTYNINTYKALLDTNIRIGAMDTIYMRHYVEKSKLKIQAELYERKIGPKGYYTLDDGMRKMRNEFFAFHCEIAAAFDYISANFDEHETCRIQIMPGYTEHMRGYTMVPKNSPYKKIFKLVEDRRIRNSKKKLLSIRPHAEMLQSRRRFPEHRSPGNLQRIRDADHRMLHLDGPLVRRSLSAQKGESRRTENIEKTEEPESREKKSTHFSMCRNYITPD
ncbi:PREDICTED: glutamate receptor 4-like [Nicrophorus vespilloides]|uniref:Glutamate receptor 4-like n=1 Tax=Nicrophorus vespilloides TaxID=110193 RepID=A0ABM1NJ80_NICVS|nr:PREDICTED: glutamate receptor 4-like [Nicrophorus vespilloides]